VLALGWQRGDFANRRFERQEMFVADVMAEKARHGAHGPWMTVRFISWAVERHFAGIEADAGPRLAQAGVDVFFAGHEIDGAGLCFVRQDKIHQRVFGRFLHAWQRHREFLSDCLNPGFAERWRTLDDVAKAWKKSPEDTLMDFVLADKAQTGAIYFMASEKTSNTGLSQPWTSIGLDAGECLSTAQLMNRTGHPRPWAPCRAFSAITSATNISCSRSGDSQNHLAASPARAPR